MPAGPTPKVIVFAADRVHVALLVDRLGGHPQAAVAPDDVLEHPRGRLVRVERTRHRRDRPRADLMTARDQLGELAHDALAGVRLRLLAVERQQVAAQEHLALQMRLERAQHGVLAARQLDGDVVGKLDLGPHPLERRPHEPGHAAAVGAAVDSRHRLLHDPAHVLRRLRAAVAHRLLDDRLQLLL